MKFWGVVDQFAALHAEHFAHLIHRSSHFLPWHREFLLRFERKLKEKHRDVTLPYWDSTVDRSPSDPLWSSGFLGRFNSSWNLGRTLGAGGRTLPTAQQVEANQSRATYREFWPELENPIHNMPHTWVGGVMATTRSPGDPVFYMHHCWIDMLWTRWQRAHPGAPFDSSGSWAGLNDPLMGYPDRTPAHVLDHRALGYAYDTDPAPGGPSAQGDDMQPGEILRPGEALRSPNQRYTFVYQADGNLVLYGPKGWLWDSATDGKPVGACVMQGDGNLVLYGPGAVYVWDTDTWQHPGSRLYVQDDGNVVIYRPDGTAVWATETAQGSGACSLSINYPNHYVRHRNFLGEISRVGTDLDRRDATFTLGQGLADANAVSFGATNFADHYLWHQGYRLKLQPYSNESLYRTDATFVVVPGLADGTKVSFRSINYPNHYLRHRSFALYLEAGSDPSFRQDATFEMVAPLWAGG